MSSMLSIERSGAGKMRRTEQGPFKDQVLKSFNPLETMDVRVCGRTIYSGSPRTGSAERVIVSLTFVDHEVGFTFVTGLCALDCSRFWKHDGVAQDSA